MWPTGMTTPSLSSTAGQTKQCPSNHNHFLFLLLLKIFCLEYPIRQSNPFNFLLFDALNEIPT
jgi:hypothetical protein